MWVASPSTESARPRPQLVSTPCHASRKALRDVPWRHGSGRPISESRAATHAAHLRASPAARGARSGSAVGPLQMDGRVRVFGSEWSSFGSEPGSHVCCFLLLSFYLLSLLLVCYSSRVCPGTQNGISLMS